MKRGSAIILGAIGITAIAIGTIDAFSRRNSKVHIEKETDVPRSNIIDIISHVEYEPELIPFVDSVEILGMGQDCVRYEVKGSVYGIPWWMHYRKVWDKELGIAKWASEKGSYGLRSTGRIVIKTDMDGNRIILDSKYSIRTPVLNRIAEKVMYPMLRYAFNIWLQKLSDKEFYTDYMLNSNSDAI